MSFEGHLRAMQRMVADQVGQAVDAGQFFGLKPQGDLLILKLDEHAKGNYPNLGLHPRDETLPVPIPPAMERDATRAATIIKMHPKDRKKALADLLDQLSEEAKA
jgi:hypothetical protein